MISQVNRNEKLFKALVENQYSITLLVNSKFETIYTSPSSEIITGWTAEDRATYPMEKRTHPDDYNYLKEIFLEVLNNPGKQISILIRTLHKKGFTQWLEGTIINRLNDPDVNAIVTNLRDITDRKLAEVQLLESEKKYRDLFENNPLPMWVISEGERAFLDVNEAAILNYGYTRDEFLSMTAYDIRPEDERDAFAAYDCMPGKGLHNTGIWRQLRKDGSIIHAEVNIDEIVFNGKPARLVLATDVTDKVKAEEKIVKANRLYFFISQINQMIVRTSDEQTLFKEACSIAVGLGQFKMAWIGLFEENEEIIQLVSQDGMADEDTRLFERLKYDKEGPQADVLRTGKYYVCNDLENEFKLESWRLIASMRNVRSVMVTPIRRFGRIIGTFNFYAPTVNFFDKEEIELLEEAAGDVSFALGVFEREFLRKKAEQEIVIKNEELKKLSSHLQNIREEERTYIAREIHDELGQELTALKMDIDWLKHTQPDQVVNSKLDAMLQLTDRTINTVRRIASDLRPGILDDLGLLAAIEWKCSDFHEKSGLKCVFNSNIPERDFENNFSINVFRILQESMTNILRHANAEKVEIKIRETGTEFIMEITDDGKGIDDRDLSKRKSLGIIGMKERAALLGGVLLVESQGIGTKIKLILPLK